MSDNDKGTTGPGPAGKEYADEKADGGNYNYQPKTDSANGVGGDAKPEK
jgi:hypothetical protein